MSTFRLNGHTRHTIDQFLLKFQCASDMIGVESFRVKPDLIQFKLWYRGYSTPHYPVEIVMTTRTAISHDEEWQRVLAIREYLDRTSQERN